MNVVIIIPTYKRKQQLISCIRSINKLIQKNISVYIVDLNQDTTLSSLILTNRRNRRLHYVTHNKSIKSSALNAVINQTNSDIIAFTDDDCIVSRSWVTEMISSFTKHPKIACVTGNTYPYGDISTWACPPTISTTEFLFAKPTHHRRIGFGNNFAIKRSVLKSVGLFKTWLGPGSISTNCEDGDMLLRILMKHHKIFHNPKMVVYHNKRLNKFTLKTQNLSYICGEMACYGYHALSGYGFASIVVSKNYIESLRDIKRLAGDIIKRKTFRPHDWIFLIMVLVTRIKGFTIGFMYYVKERVFKIQ